jgi:hypothetical protein
MEATLALGASSRQRALRESPRDAGVVDRDGVGVDGDNRGEAPVGRFEANHLVIGGRPEVTVTLSVGVHSERRNGYPGHGELDRPAAAQEAVAEDRHHVRHRRQAEVAVERVG